VTELSGKLSTERSRCRKALNSTKPPASARHGASGPQAEPLTSASLTRFPAVWSCLPAVLLHPSIARRTLWVPGSHADSVFINESDVRAEL